EVNHLGARGLQDAPHDVDRGVVSIEERSRADDADGMSRSITLARHDPKLDLARVHAPRRIARATTPTRSASAPTLTRTSTTIGITLPPLRADSLVKTGAAGIGG